MSQTQEQPYWRPRPGVPARKIEEGPTAIIPPVRPRIHTRPQPVVVPGRVRTTGTRWFIALALTVLACLAVGLAVVLGLAVGHAFTPQR